MSKLAIFFTFSSIGNLKLILRRILRQFFHLFFSPLDPSPVVLTSFKKIALVLNY